MHLNLFCRFCKLRRKSYISNVTSQRYHLSSLISYMSQRKASNWSDHAQINEKTSHRNDQIFCEKISQRVYSTEFFCHYRFYVDVRNHFKCIIFLIWHCNVKHRIKTLDLVNSQRVEETLEISLSTRFIRLIKLINDELHKKRH